MVVKVKKKKNTAMEKVLSENRNKSNTDTAFTCATKITALMKKPEREEHHCKYPKNSKVVMIAGRC